MVVRAGERAVRTNILTTQARLLNRAGMSVNRKLPFWSGPPVQRPFVSTVNGARFSTVQEKSNQSQKIAEDGSTKKLQALQAAGNLLPNAGSKPSLEPKNKDKQATQHVCLEQPAVAKRQTTDIHNIAAEQAPQKPLLSKCLRFEQIHQVMQKKTEMRIPSVNLEKLVCFVDVENTIAYWDPQNGFDWNPYWKHPKIGSDKFNKLKGPMFNQIRVLMQEYGWSEEEVIQRLVRGYFEALANEKIVCEPTEWAPDFEELVTKMRATEYLFIIYTHAMITFSAYEARNFCKRLKEIIAKHNLKAQIEFICGSDPELFHNIELPAVSRAQSLADPNDNLKEYFDWFKSEFKHVKFSCVTKENKGKQESWSKLFKLHGIDPNSSGVVLIDDEEKNRNAFLAHVKEALEENHLKTAGEGKKDTNTTRRTPHA